MGFDSRANQGTDSPEGSDESPGVVGAPGPGGYQTSPGPGSPPAGNWQPGPGSPPGPPTYRQQAYGAPPPGPYSGGGGYAPAPPPGYGPPPGGYGAYPSGYGYSAPVAPRTDGTAIAALVLAICSFMVCPIVPAVIALAMVPGSRRTIYASGGAVSGLGLLTATKIIAWINIGLGLLAVVGIVVIAIVSAATSTSNAMAGILTL